MAEDTDTGSYGDYRRTFATLKGKGVSLNEALRMTVLGTAPTGKLTPDEIVYIAREIYDTD